MKRISLLSVLLFIFVGCAHKTECGHDECGNKYVDKTYRSYAQSDCSNNCDIELVNAYTTCKPCATKTIKAAPTASVLEKSKPLRITVKGQGVAPMNAISPAQSYALAKRAATSDAYRLVAEKVKGVYVEGQDLIQNMMVKKSTVRTSVQAMIRNANIVETTFKEGLCEVEMEIVISHAQFAQ